MLAGISGSINDALDKVLLRRLVGEEEGLLAVGNMVQVIKLEY
jgi:hypothetical protein